MYGKFSTNVLILLKEVISPPSVSFVSSLEGATQHYHTYSHSLIAEGEWEGCDAVVKISGKESDPLTVTVVPTLDWRSSPVDNEGLPLLLKRTEGRIRCGSQCIFYCVGIAYGELDGGFHKLSCASFYSL